MPRRFLPYGPVVKEEAASMGLEIPRFLHCPVRGSGIMIELVIMFRIQTPSGH